MIAYGPTRDDILGDYFNGVITDDSDMGLEETAPGYYVPNSFFTAWEQGWTDAVREFWNQIEGKL